MKIYVIVKGTREDEYELVEKPESGYYSLLDDKSADDMIDSWGYKSYLNKHGHHFSERLAQYACDMMVNSNGKSHKWTPELLSKTLKMYGLNDHGRYTIGDLTYLANMAYADLYPTVLKDEISCLKYAIAMANDPDGYDGMPLKRWMSDMKSKGCPIQWEKFC